MTLTSEPKRQETALLPEPRPVASTRVLEAIAAAFPYMDGEMTVRHVGRRAGMEWYRVNWYRKDDRGPFIYQSKFLVINESPDGVVVEDHTATDRPAVVLK